MSFYEKNLTLLKLLFKYGTQNQDYKKNIIFCLCVKRNVFMTGIRFQPRFPYVNKDSVLVLYLRNFYYEFKITLYRSNLNLN